MKHKHLRILCLLLLAGLLSTHSEVRGQALEMNGFAGYQLGGKARLWDAEFKIHDAMNYGGRISVGLSTTTYAEITYMRSDTEGDYLPLDRNQTPVRGIPFSSNYISVAGLQEMHFGPASPFLTLGAGLTVWSPKVSTLNSKTQFHALFGGGLKIWLSDNLGIRLQGTMLMPVVWDGFGFGCGIGTGGSSCGGSLYTRITPFQGEFSGGLIIKISPN